MATTKSNLRDTFAGRLKTLMREGRLTQRQVADAAGVSRPAVVKWLRGSIPGAGELFQLARAVGKPLEWFLGAIQDSPANKGEISKLHTAADEIPADKFRDAARQVGLRSVQDWEQILHRTLTSRLVTRLLPDGTIHISFDPAEPAPKISSKGGLTDVIPKDKNRPVRSPVTMTDLLARLRVATSRRGAKTALAGELKLSKVAISRWLSGEREPSGETTLKLLNWVEEREREQQKTGSDSASTPSNPKTRSNKSSYEKKTIKSGQEQA